MWGMHATTTRLSIGPGRMMIDLACRRLLSMPPFATHTLDRSYYYVCTPMYTPPAADERERCRVRPGMGAGCDAAVCVHILRVTCMRALYLWGGIWDASGFGTVNHTQVFLCIAADTRRNLRIG
jgi:hypothetical protein